MSVRDGRCDSLCADGSRCTRDAARGQHDFAWCWQHWRLRQGESVRVSRRKLDRAPAPATTNGGRR